MGVFFFSEQVCYFHCESKKSPLNVDVNVSFFRFQSIGCDKMLHSGVKFDACMECGGDGSTCTTVSDTADTHHLRNGKDNHPCTSVSTILYICQFSSPLILTQKRSKRNFITFPLVCSLFVVVMYCCNVLFNVQCWSMYVHSKLYVFTLTENIFIVSRTGIHGVCLSSCQFYIQVILPKFMF